MQDTSSADVNLYATMQTQVWGARSFQQQRDLYQVENSVSFYFPDFSQSSAASPELADDSPSPVWTQNFYVWNEPGDDNPSDLLFIDVQPNSTTCTETLTLQSEHSIGGTIGTNTGMQEGVSTSRSTSTECAGIEIFNLSGNQEYQGGELPSFVGDYKQGAWSYMVPDPDVYWDSAFYTTGQYTMVVPWSVYDDINQIMIQSYARGQTISIHDGDVAYDTGTASPGVAVPHPFSTRTLDKPIVKTVEGASSAQVSCGLDVEIAGEHLYLNSITAVLVNGTPAPCSPSSNPPSCNWTQTEEGAVTLLTDCDAMVGDNQIVGIQTKVGQSEQTDILLTVTG